VTNDRHNCIKDSLSQPHSTLYLHSRYMGEVQGMMTTARVTAKAFNGVFMCSFTRVDLVMHLYNYNPPNHTDALLNCYESSADGYNVFH